MSSPAPATPATPGTRGTSLGTPLRRLARALALVSLIGGSTIACGMVMMRRNVTVPPPLEFGLGPRTSQHGAFTATLVPAQKLSVGKTQAVAIAVVDRTGNPVDSATITINGGMPQHGHGLPTKPQVRNGTAPGRYTIAGLRFNMGGWWVVSFVIRTPDRDGRSAAADSVTFNIRL